MPVLHPQSAIYVHGTHVFDWVVVAFAVPLFALFGYLLLFDRCRHVSLAPVCGIPSYGLLSYHLLAPNASASSKMVPTTFLSPKGANRYQVL